MQITPAHLKLTQQQKQLTLARLKSEPHPQDPEALANHIHFQGSFEQRKQNWFGTVSWELQLFVVARFFDAYSRPRTD